MDTTLVVMAAGMGSRFGGLKQAAPITNDGKGILDFSVYDAKKAGFSKVVFIIRKEIESDFKNLVGNRISSMLPVEYVIQDTNDLPEGRVKPFGTGHAIYCCKDVVNTPFCIINADDYYGSNAFIDIQKYLSTAKEGDYSMVAYQLEKTLSKNGTVNRGICQIQDGYLTSIKEGNKIDENGFYFEDDVKKQLPLDTKVSMNIWGLTPDIFPVLEREYKKFLTTADLAKDELYIQLVIFSHVLEGKAKVKVFYNKDRWYGITYKEDLPEVKENLNRYIKEGLYKGF